MGFSLVNDHQIICNACYGVFVGQVLIRSVTLTLNGSTIYIVLVRMFEKDYF
jgi:hypothetical protein